MLLHRAGGDVTLGGVVGVLGAQGGGEPGRRVLLAVGQGTLAVSGCGTGRGCESVVFEEPLGPFSVENLLLGQLVRLGPAPVAATAAAALLLPAPGFLVEVRPRVSSARLLLLHPPVESRGPLPARVGHEPLLVVQQHLAAAVVRGGGAGAEPHPAVDEREAVGDDVSAGAAAGAADEGKGAGNRF